MKIDRRDYIKFLVITIAIVGFSCNVNASVPSSLDTSFVSAKVNFQNNLLTVSTGKVIRKWQITGSGYKTVSFKQVGSDYEWCLIKDGHSCDWNLPSKIDNQSVVQLVSVNCTETDDERFTTRHLLVTTIFRYDCGLEIRHLVRVYPNAPGVWTALEVRAIDGFNPEGIPDDLAYFKSYGSSQPLKIARNEYLPVDFSKKNQRFYWGLYNDPGNRVNTSDMVKVEVKNGFPLFQDEENSWASGLVVSAGSNGLILLKESNKTVNKYGHQTGAFYSTPVGIEVTGWGLKPNEISNDFKRCWPTWSILYSGNKDDMELALKMFDRIRFPVNKGTDMHLLVDTWGSDYRPGDIKTLWGRENSEFHVVENEIKSAAELGIDIVRIDDGWQNGTTLSRNTWHPNTTVGYDADWSNVRRLSEKYGVKIGLWAAINYITPYEMMLNQKQLNVATWKLDFDELKDHDAFAKRLAGMRNFIRNSDYKTQTSWCPEYDDQRYGWYSAVRECGPMFFQNIQNNLPNHVVFVPYITLRHHWMMSAFYNMNDLQCSWQNPALTNPKFSDAVLHSHSYCAMSSFVGVPSFFMLTQLLSLEAKEEIKKLISIYKENQSELFECFVFPIGNEPDNSSWTGFQFYHPDKKSGYLMIFRELHNDEMEYAVKLRFLRGEKIRFLNLETGENKNIRLTDGKVPLSIEHPADYLFLKYEKIFYD